MTMKFLCEKIGRRGRFMKLK